MLSEPLSITYDGVAKSLARTQFASDKTPSAFVASNNEFRMIMSEIQQGDSNRVEVILERAVVDTDPDNGYQYLPNRFGVVYEFNRSQYNTATDIPLLRSALLAFLDTTVQGRILAGEK